MIKSIFNNFEEMITPKLITILFYFLVALDFVTAITVMMQFFGPYYGFFLKLFGIVFGIFYFAFAVLVSRVACELLVVVFKINDHTKEISEKLNKN